MKSLEASRTALMAAIGRGMHREQHAPPWVLDDPFALVLVGPQWRAIYAQLDELMPEDVRHEVVGGIVGRSRYAEDRLDGFEQYVPLGAGLDSFAWRRPDRMATLRVFEVDHPASQAGKRARADELGLPIYATHVYTPIDFETETLRDALETVGFDFERPALFSWLGVVPYLTLEAVEATLRFVAECAPGSEIVMSYGGTEETLDDVGRRFLDLFGPLAAQSGEPLQTYLSPADAEALLERCGLAVADHPSREEWVARYFGERADGLVPYTVEAMITGAVTRR